LIFLPAGIFLSAALFLSADFVAYSWLGAQDKDASLVIKLIALNVFFRWIVMFYQATLLGMEKHTLINVGQISYQILVPVIGIAGIYLRGWGLIELVWCYLAGSAVLATVFCWLSWRNTGGFSTAIFDARKARQLAAFAFKVAGVTIPGIALMEIDKIVASKILDLETFGWYVLVANVASALVILATPIYQVAFPRLTSLHAAGDQARFMHLYRMFTRMSALMVFPAAIALAVFSEPVLMLYTGKPDLVEGMWPVFSILLVAKAFHASGMIPYAVQVARKELRLGFYLNVASLALMAVSLPILSSWLGAIGLAWSWFLVTFGYFTLGMWLFHRTFFRGGYWQWLTRDNLPVISLSLLTSVVILKLLEPAASLEGLLQIALAGLLSFLLSLSVLPDLRNQLVSSVRATFRADSK
jgi:O-antigen/teichoic acid export membrane protein